MRSVISQQKSMQTPPAATRFSALFPMLPILLTSAQCSQSTEHRLEGSVLDHRWKVDIRLFSLETALRFAFSHWSALARSARPSPLRRKAEALRFAPDRTFLIGLALRSNEKSLISRPCASGRSPIGRMHFRVKLWIVSVEGPVLQGWRET